MRRRLVVGALVILAAMVSPLLFDARIQAVTAVTGMTLNEGDFWSRMEQTKRLLDEAATLSGAQQDSAVASEQQLWEGVDSVRLADETVIPVDMGWLRTNPATNTELQALQRRVQALLDYHARQTAGTSGDPGRSLSTLDQVLHDPNYQYPDATPTPTPEPNPQVQSQAPSLGAPDVWQLAFVLAGLILVAGVLFFLGRTQRFQRAALNQPEDTGDDPPTSTAAHDLAAESEAARDYRRAIRYLYLASLLKLDERGLIHYDRTLTNREHLRQIRGNPQLVEALQPVIYTFDRVWYGFAPVDEPGYQDFRQRVERLEKLTPGVTPGETP